MGEVNARRCSRRGGRACRWGLVVLLMLGGPACEDSGRRKEGDEREAEEGENIVVTIVYDNNPGEKRLTPAWGFGCVVRGFAKTMLFDTGGSGDILLANMSTLGIKTSEIDAVVLSHIHGDHTGGLAAFLKENNKVTVFLPAAFPERFKNGVRRAGATVVETKKAVEVCPGASTTGVLGDGIKEQGLYLETAEGIVVITGCAHPGIVNLTRATKGASEKRVHAALGGFHLSGASAKKISSVIKGLQDLGVGRAGPCHCSGDRTRKMMREAFGKNYMDLAVGARISFARPKTEKEEK